jgi:hypothetical protein
MPASVGHYFLRPYPVVRSQRQVRRNRDGGSAGGAYPWKRLAAELPRRGSNMVSMSRFPLVYVEP